MNILFAHNMYQQAGGEDTVVTSEMALLRSRGHRVELYQRHNDELHTLPPAAAARTTLWSAQTIHELDVLCREFQPALIHVHNTFPLISPSIYWLASRRGIPIIQTLHNFRLLCPQGTFLRNGVVCEDCIGKQPWRAVVHKCYRNSRAQSLVLAGMLTAHRMAGTWRNRVTRYIALTEFSRDRFVASGLSEEQVCVKPNFVDTSVPPGWRTRHGGMYVGRLSEEKGVGTLLAAIARGGTASPIVIGAGPLGPQMKQQLGDSYLGFLSRDEIMQKMHAASFLLVPSLCLEQLPTTILEAFACGLPVIASRLGALPGIVEDRVTGLLFKAGDAADLAEKMAWAASHGAEMAQMGRAAHAQYLRKYSPSINYQIMQDIYQDAIAANSKERHGAQRTFGAGHLG
jgi:glycosyltransferase involved in cell wall biosynthesis